MKKTIYLLVLSAGLSLSAISQNNPLTSGGSNDEVTFSNKTDIVFSVEKKVEVDLLQAVIGTSKGFKFVPILPFFPRHTAGVIDISAREAKAERAALAKAGGDILLNKRVERTYTGFFLVFWFEKIEVSGMAAKLKK